MNVYAVPGRHNIIDTIDDGTGLTSAFHHTFEQVREREPLAKLYTWEAWRAEQIARQQTPITWEPSTAEQYREMLEILPPAFWQMDLFLVGEPMDHSHATGHPRFEAFWFRGGQYLKASRPITRDEARSIVNGAL